MARSSYVYVVLRRWWDDCEPIAAFTVKYEAINYVRHLEKAGETKIIEVIRLCDGDPRWVVSKPYHYTKEELFRD